MSGFDGAFRKKQDPCILFENLLVKDLTNHGKNSKILCANY